MAVSLFYWIFYFSGVVSPLKHLKSNYRAKREIRVFRKKIVKFPINFDHFEKLAMQTRCGACEMI